VNLLHGKRRGAQNQQATDLGSNGCAQRIERLRQFRRLEAVSGLPSTMTYGLAATCSIVIPAASTMSAVRKSGYEGTMAAGTNRNAPRP